MLVDRLGRCARLRRCWRLYLGLRLHLLCLHSGLLAGLVLAAAAAAAMPLRLLLTGIRRKPLFWLGLR